MPHKVHVLRAIKTNEASHIARIKGQVEPGPDADFEYAAVSSRNDTAAIGSEVSPAHR
jgi:hypothetical protein